MSDEVSLQVVIGLMGPKGCGKDTVADLSIKNMGAIGKLATASFLKRLCSQILKIHEVNFVGEAKDKPFVRPFLLRGIHVRNILDEMDRVLPVAVKQQHGLKLSRIGVQKYADRTFTTPRQVLQYVGTELIQSVFPQFHCVVAYEQLRGRPGVWFITDLRFKHEESYAKEVFPLFYPVKIVGRAEVEAGAEEHVSESQYKDIEPFTTIDNSGSLAELAKSAGEAFKKIKADIKKRAPKLSVEDLAKMTCPPAVASLPTTTPTEIKGTSKNPNVSFFYQKKDDIVDPTPRDM